MSKDNDKELSDVKMKTTGLGAIMGHIQQNIETIEKETKPDPTSSVSIKLYTQFFSKIVWNCWFFNVVETACNAWFSKPYFFVK